jgi:hypothetical protein
LTYFFNNHWAANFSLGILSYKHTKNTNNSNDEINTSETVNAGVNSGGLGIGFYFRNQLHSFYLCLLIQHNEKEINHDGFHPFSHNINFSSAITEYVLDGL